MSARKVDPWKRPGLGPWLNDAGKRAQWDGLIFSRQDRIARSSLDWHKLVKWLAEYDKTMICLDPMADLTTASGRFVAGVIAGFGEMEADMIAARVKDAVTALRQVGQYAGGAVPFGLMPVRLLTGKGWGFMPDPEFAPVVAEMARRFLAGESLNQIADWLNDEHIPTSQDVMRRRQNVLRREQGKPEKPERGTKWRHSTVSKVLGSPSIIGDMTKDGGVLRDADGMPIGRCDPIISAEDFALIQKKLETNSDRTGPRVNSAVLLRVAYCGGCGSVLHMNTATAGNNAQGSKDKVYRYYECAGRREGNGCTERKIRAEIVEEMLEQGVLDQVGNDKTRTRRVITATDNTAEIKQIEDAIDNLTATYASAGMSVERFAKTVANLEATQARLVAEDEEKKQRPAEPKWKVGTDTVSEHWSKVADRNAYLRGASVKIYVQHHEVEDPDFAWEHDLMGVPETQVKVPLPDDEHVSVVRLYKDGITAKLFLGDLSREALRAA